MAPLSRDRISVDLHGLKAALFERAKALGISPSGLVRTTLAEALGQGDRLHIHQSKAVQLRGKGGRVRLSLRMNRQQASATLDAARRAGLNPGDYVGGLVAGVPVLLGVGCRPDHLASLIASNAELSTFSRNLHLLSKALRQGVPGPAQAYRPMLHTLGAEVRNHLTLVAAVLADMRPPRGGHAATAKFENH